ncbi:MAG: hypothetical protein J0L70_11290 [Leptolyngbya sp. UWPOB_LEPTO1]|uniref:hypothetical protein n=1 Tax=Leptolyngbya sp. UWPOB_LEPTO1 TaxID=2815653 RepID=UPI001AD5BBB4|nr:hypothetical protein [Leptolyngbya sp. UWPOB_LEPTO1]MBN8561100.1 hypothetical protein [Leptolyngbya sp. UWPOB_LEPTO1]
MNYRLSSVCESPAEYESLPDQKSVELAGHQRDSTRLQLNLFDQEESELSPNGHAIQRVLGGEDDTIRPPSTHSCGWIEFHTVRRKRKNGDIWETKQPWLHWEEKGQKRSRYIPKAKYADVENSVYGMRSPIQETLRLLEKGT